MTVALEHWCSLLARIGCVCCTRGFAGGSGRDEQHHVAQGSGKRNEFNRTVLCWGHHQGGAGLHGMGSKAFLRLYRPPGDDEFGLVAWAIEDVAKLLYADRKRKKTLEPAGGLARGEDPGESEGRGASARAGDVRS